MKNLVCFFCLCFALPSSAVYFDWSGWTRVEAYYQNSKNHNYYGSYHLVGQPKIHIVDGLSVSARLDLDMNTENSFASSKNYRQAGAVILYAEDSAKQDVEFERLFLTVSQIYLDYTTEFIKFRAGRAPHHFGLGATYSASKSPFSHWMSVYNQVSLYAEYTPFYVQPLLIHNRIKKDKTEEEQAVLLQAGFLQEDWKLEAFYQYDFKDSFVELFGQYKQDSWELKGSASYVIVAETNMAFALETAWDIAGSFPFKFEFKGGGALGDYSFHPNYDVALLLWNRHIGDKPLVASEGDAPQENPSSTDSVEKKIQPFRIAEGQIHSGIYASPRLVFSFLNDSLRVRPLIALARSFKDQKFHYELDLEGMLKLENNAFIALKGGSLYSDKKFHFALLAQAVALF